jgi:hypothetical protein
MIAGDLKRGAAFAVLIPAVFVAGIGYGGYILEPVWHFRNPEFNLVAVLTYVTQAFFGLGWLALQGLHLASEQSPESFFNLQRLAATHTFSDLGSFHLVVAGGLNYLSTVRLYDLLTGNEDLSAPDYKPETAGTSEVSAS